jgi:predicted dehydrogenase
MFNEISKEYSFNMKQINWGIIGCGNVTEMKSGPAFNRVENSRLIAVMRRTPGKAKDYAQRHNVPKWYEDAKELINDRDINAVYVATPPVSHAKYAIMAANAGKHVYVEKPMALNFRECQKMIGATDQAGVSLFVAYYRRCLPSFLKVKEWLDSGTIGTPRAVSISLIKPVWQFQNPIQTIPWRFRPEISGGGLLQDLGSHQLDFMDYLFGPITSIKSFAANQAGIYGVEDMVTGCFNFGSGVQGTAAWCFTASKESQEDCIQIIGSKGKILFSTFDFTPIQLVTTEGTKELHFAKPKHVQEDCIRSIVNDLLGMEQCPSTGITASRTTKIIDDILCSKLNM